METKQLPTLDYPFGNLGLHPLVLETEEMSEMWIQQVYKTKQNETLEKSKASATLCGHFTARMYPTAKRDNLMANARFLLWGLINDDYLDELSEEVHKETQEKYDRILFEGYNPHADDLPMFIEMAAIRDDMNKLMPKEWMKHFAESVHLYLEGMIEELYYKRAMIWPTIGEYTRVRQKSVCVYPLFALLEVSEGFMLPDYIYYSPPFKRLADLFCNILAWTNDYFSIKKEQGIDVMNLILINQYWNKTDLHTAYEMSVAIHDNDVSEILAICNSLPNFGEHQEAVDHFIENMKLCIHGQRDWYIFDTRRYPLVIDRN